jgi:hypothetical protein
MSEGSFNRRDWRTLTLFLVLALLKIGLIAAVLIAITGPKG